MPNDAIKPALRTALRVHEIGARTPYEISFARKANSGGSFGFMQGDLAAGQPIAHSTFRQAMAAAGMPQARIDSLEQRLSTKGAQDNIITAAERHDIDAALQGSQALVNAMDESILTSVYRGLDMCIASAAQGHRTIAPIAQLYAAMWINMTGPPDKILDFLKGPVPHNPVSENDIQTYLRASKYYTEHPGNFPHLVESAQKGAAELPAA